MIEISKSLQETLKESLQAYYTSISEGNVTKLSALMTRESYLTTMRTLGFKIAFKDENFAHLLEAMQDDTQALSKVEAILSLALKAEVRKNVIQVISYEQKGVDRITVHYKEDAHVKKIYFSKQNENWEIDFKAGRKKDI